MDKVKIGLIGAGKIGRLHAENICSSVRDAELVAVADILMNRETEQWMKGLGIGKCCKDPSEIFNDPSIDAVFICSSTNTHADFIIEAAKAGKQIFCEKPISDNLEMIHKALDAVEKAGVTLQVGFVRRFDHNHKKVRDTVASGVLGKPHIVKVTSRDPEPPSMDYVRVSGGIFMDMMIHDFDMVRYLSGSEVTEVAAYGGAMIDREFERYHDVDTAIVMLKFENGAIGVIENSRATHYGYDQRTEVLCDKGCVQVANDLEDTSMISTGEGVVCAKPTWFFLERYNDAFISEERMFVSAVLKDTEPLVGGIDGLRSVEIAEAAKKSLQEGRMVKLAEIR